MSKVKISMKLDMLGRRISMESDDCCPADCCPSEGGN